MNKILIWVLRIIAAVIMLQTLYFKFTGQPESVKLFTILGMEPWGRIGTGVLELIASVLILIPRTTIWGAIMGLGLMSGAIFFHLTNNNVGIYFNGDVLLFMYAVLVWVSCFFLVFIFKNQLLQVVKMKVKI